MIIPDKFKFVVPEAEHDIVFSATFDGADVFLINWTVEENGQTEKYKGNYRKEYVEKSLNDGTWVIVDEKENITKLPNAFKFYWVNDPASVYAADVRDGMVTIRWGGNTSQYEAVYIEHLISEGHYVIIEQEGKVKPLSVEQMETIVAELLAKAEEWKQQIEKEKQKKENGRPDVGNEYYSLSTSSGVVHRYVWCDCSLDHQRADIGNVFRTQEEADTYLVKRKIETKLRALAEKSWKDAGTVMDWNNPQQCKYHIVYEISGHQFSVEGSYEYCHFGKVFFESHFAAANAIKELGEDNLKLLME